MLRECALCGALSRADAGPTCERAILTPGVAFCTNREFKVPSEGRLRVEAVERPPLEAKLARATVLGGIKLHEQPPFGVELADLYERLTAAGLKQDEVMHAVRQLARDGIVAVKGVRVRTTKPEPVSGPVGIVVQ